MIVVLSRSQSGFRPWARQFVAHDRQNRDVVLFPDVRNGAAGQAQARGQIESVYGAAAQRAGEGGTVIISVGHGGSDAGAGLAAGMADLAPNRALRLQRDHVLYSRRQSDVSTTRRATAVGVERCQGLLGQYDFDEETSLPAPPGDLVMDLAACYGAGSARERLAIRAGYDTIGRLLRRNQVASVIFLSCSIGGATRFVDQIGEDWGVRVTAYTRRVAVIEDEGGQWRVYLDGDSPGRGTNTERGRTEVPDRDQYVSGTS